MTGDQSAQLKQVREHYNALRLDLDAAEQAGADIAVMAHAKELLSAAVAKAEEAIVQAA